MPLDDNGKLRFQVMDSNRDAVISKLASWDWAPVPVSVLPRITPQGMQAATLYEIDLPRERQPVVDDRRMIPGELATERQKTASETEQMLKYLGWK